MGLTTIVNDLTVVHASSAGVAICGAPDVCLTPSGPAMVPLPYVNIAFSRDLVDGTSTVFVDGSSVATKASSFGKSIGDEPGIGGGVLSGVNMGKAKFSSYSMDVFFEGENVARLSDSMTMNGNAPNTATDAEIQENLERELGIVFDILCMAFCFCDTAGNLGGDFVKLPPDPAPPEPAPSPWTRPTA